MSICTSATVPVPPYRDQAKMMSACLPLPPPVGKSHILLNILVSITRQITENRRYLSQFKVKAYFITTSNQDGYTLRVERLIVWWSLTRNYNEGMTVRV